MNNLYGDPQASALPLCMHIWFVSTFIRIRAKHKLPRATDAYSNN